MEIKMIIDSLLSDLSVKEIARKKEKLQQDILDLINDFEKETNVRVKNLNIVTVNEIKTIYTHLDFGIS